MSYCVFEKDNFNKIYASFKSALGNRVYGAGDIQVINGNIVLKASFSILSRYWANAKKVGRPYIYIICYAPTTSST